MIKEIFNESYRQYNEYMEQNVPDYWDYHGFLFRRMQIESFINALNDNFNFQKLITIETGASQNLRDSVFGLFLGMATEKTQGRMISVDIDNDILDRSNILFKLVTPTLSYQTYKDDSVNFLLHLDESPNLVHLDSWDLDLKNPFPCALHGWREFVAIESKMPSGGIIIIDDNYIQGTWVDWHYPDGQVERINNIYPMIGKGANVYHHILSGNSNWKLIGEQYSVFNNIKIIIQKK
jgi:hypothetical protein